MTSHVWKPFPMFWECERCGSRAGGTDVPGESMGRVAIWNEFKVVRPQRHLLENLADCDAEIIRKVVDS